MLSTLVASLKETDLLQDLGVGGDNIKRGVRNSGSDGAVCIRLAQCSDRWRAFVSTVMDFAFHKMIRVY